jgi:hypothetical protein
LLFCDIVKRKAQTMSHQEKEQQPAQMNSLSAESEGGATMAPRPFQLQAASEDPMLVSSGQSPAEEVAAWMSREMIINAGSSTCAEIAQLWNSWNPADKISALFQFADMVGYGQPWDHKTEIRTRWTEWQDDPGAGVKWYFDIWSNIHYGYVGRACGFSNSVLLNAAGIAQALGSQVPGGLGGYIGRRLEQLGDADVFRALDDPSDQACSRIGFNMSTPTMSNMLTQIRNNKDSITHQVIA